MPAKGTSVKGVRLPDAVWSEIDSEAAELGMTRNELLGRRLKKAFSRVPEVGKSVQKVVNSDSESPFSEAFE